LFRETCILSYGPWLRGSESIPLQKDLLISSIDYDEFTFEIGNFLCMAMAIGTLDNRLQNSFIISTNIDNHQFNHIPAIQDYVEN